MQKLSAFGVPPSISWEGFEQMRVNMKRRDMNKTVVEEATLTVTPNLQKGPRQMKGLPPQVHFLNVSPV